MVYKIAMKNKIEILILLQHQIDARKFLQFVEAAAVNNNGGTKSNNCVEQS